MKRSHAKENIPNVDKHSSRRLSRAKGQSSYIQQFPDHLGLDKLESEPECRIDLHSLSLTRLKIFPTITKPNRDKSREAPISGWGVLMAMPTKAVRTQLRACVVEVLLFIGRN